MYKLSNLKEDYDENFKETQEPKWMQDIRREAFLSYNKLPFEVSQLYTKYSNANHLAPDKVLIDIENVDKETEDWDNRRDDLSKGPSVLCKNSKIVKTFLPERLSKEGVIITDISEAIQKFPDLLYHHFAKNKLDFNEDRYLALTLAAFENGFFVYIPREVVIEDPVKIINNLSKSGSSSIARNVVVSEPYSKCTIVQELYSPNLKNKDIQ